MHIVMVYRCDYCGRTQDDLGVAITEEAGLMGFQIPHEWEISYNRGKEELFCESCKYFGD